MKRLLTVAAALALTAAGQSQNSATAAFLRIHNDARAALRVPPLQWSAKLAAYAQEWANEIARSGKFEHRPNNPYGENLAGSTASADPAVAANMWLEEKKSYHGEKIDGRNFKTFGHYTQMIWRTTSHVGYGVARMRNGMWIVVANYDPAGNIQGQYPREARGVGEELIH